MAMRLDSIPSGDKLPNYHPNNHICTEVTFGVKNIPRILNGFVQLFFSSPSESTIGAHSVSLLCEDQTSASFSIENIPPHTITTLVSLYILQAGISYGIIAFYTLGITYLDDNSIEHNSPALIGMIHNNSKRYLISNLNDSK